MRYINSRFTYLLTYFTECCRGHHDDRQYTDNTDADGTSPTDMPSRDNVASDKPVPPGFSVKDGWQMREDCEECPSLMETRLAELSADKATLSQQLDATRTSLAAANDHSNRFV